MIASAGGAAAFAGKVVIDVTNPLKMGERGLELERGWDTSLGEAIQKALPDADVVKCWSCINHRMMIHPPTFTAALVKPDMFIAGNSESAKGVVKDLLVSAGYNRDDVLDFGDISYARAIEPLVILWVQYGMRSGTWSHAFKLLRGPNPSA